MFAVKVSLLMSLESHCVSSAQSYIYDRFNVISKVCMVNIFMFTYHFKICLVSNIDSTIEVILIHLLLHHSFYCPRLNLMVRLSVSL